MYFIHFDDLRQELDVVTQVDEYARVIRAAAESYPILRELLDLVSASGLPGRQHLPHASRAADHDGSGEEKKG